MVNYIYRLLIISVHMRIMKVSDYKLALLPCANILFELTLAGQHEFKGSYVVIAGYIYCLAYFSGFYSLLAYICISLLSREEWGG